MWMMFLRINFEANLNAGLGSKAGTKVVANTLAQLLEAPKCKNTPPIAIANTPGSLNFQCMFWYSPPRCLSNLEGMFKDIITAYEFKFNFLFPNKEES